MTQYWFKPKRFGYGATPVTWEGWVVTFATAAFVAGSVIVMELLVDKSDLAAWLVWVALIAAATWWFIQFSRRRTDGEWHWRWGKGSDAPKT
ncbi:MAG: hypothetical protein WA743_00455 [Pseudolabrys sp.]|jgi:hypothetical protein